MVNSTIVITWVNLNIDPLNGPKKSSSSRSTNTMLTIMYITYFVRLNENTHAYNRSEKVQKKPALTVHM